MLALLGNLVEQSLVVAEGAADGTVRYGMLELVRQYALEKLEEGGEREEVRRRHAVFYLALLEEAGPELKGHDQARWLGLLETELGNLRGAIAWSVERGETQLMVDSAWRSWTYWWLSGRASEGRRWIQEALADDPTISPASRAKLLSLWATLGHALGEFESSEHAIEEGMELFGELGDENGVYFAMGTAGFIDLGLGRPEEALEKMEV